MLGALGCMNNADFEKKLVNDIIVLDVLNHLYQARTGIGILNFKKNITFSIVMNN